MAVIVAARRSNPRRTRAGLRSIRRERACAWPGLASALAANPSKRCRCAASSDCGIATKAAQVLPRAEPTADTSLSWRRVPGRTPVATRSRLLFHHAVMQAGEYSKCTRRFPLLVVLLRASVQLTAQCTGSYHARLALFRPRLLGGRARPREARRS